MITLKITYKTGAVEFMHIDGSVEVTAEATAKDDLIRPSYSALLDFEFPCQGGVNYACRDSQKGIKLIETLMAIHSEQEIMQEFYRMRAWLLGQRQMKTVNGMPAFISKWIGRMNSPIVIKVQEKPKEQQGLLASGKTNEGW